MDGSKDPKKLVELCTVSVALLPLHHFCFRPHLCHALPPGPFQLAMGLKGMVPPKCGLKLAPNELFLSRSFSQVFVTTVNTDSQCCGTRSPGRTGRATSRALDQCSANAVEVSCDARLLWPPLVSDLWKQELWGCSGLWDCVHRPSSWDEWGWLSSPSSNRKKALVSFYISVFMSITGLVGSYLLILTPTSSQIFELAPWAFPS